MATGGLSIPEGFELEDPAPAAPGGMPDGFELEDEGVPARGAVRALLQGSTFGFGDEAVAGLVASARKMAGDERPFSEIFDDVAQNERDQISQYRELKPVQAFLSEGAGALLTGGAAGARVLAKQGVKKLPKWLSTAGIAGAEGTVYGAGAADPGERVKGAAMTGAISAVAAPPVAALAKVGAQLVGDAGKYVAKRLSDTPETEALRIIREAATKAGLKPDEIVRKYERLGPDGLLLDTDENFRSLMRALSDGFGPAKRQAREALEERQFGQVDRLVREIEDASGMAADDYVNGVRALAQRRAESAGPFYQRAFAEAQPSEGMLALVERPSMKAAMASGRRLAADEGQDAADQSFKQFHFAKMALDGQIGRALRAGDKTKAKSLITLKNDLLREMDEVSPEYKAGRDLYAGDSELLEAADAGRKFFSLSADEYAEALASMGQSEREMFKRGAVKAIVDKLGDSQLTYDNAKKLINTQALQGKLSALFKDEASAKRFIEQVRAEREFTRSRTVVTGGSQTSGNLAAQDGVEDSVRGAAAVLGGDATQAGLAIIGKVFGKKPPSPETIKVATELLLKRDFTPAQIRALFRESRLNIADEDVVKAENALRGSVAPSGTTTTEAITAQ